MILKIWSSFLLLLLNLVFFLDLLPRIINADSTELVLLAPILLGIMVTADYYALKMLFKKGEVK